MALPPGSMTKPRSWTSKPAAETQRARECLHTAHSTMLQRHGICARITTPRQLHSSTPTRQLSLTSPQHSFPASTHTHTQHTRTHTHTHSTMAGYANNYGSASGNAPPAPPPRRANPAVKDVKKRVMYESSEKTMAREKREAQLSELRQLVAEGKVL